MNIGIRSLGRFAFAASLLVAGMRAAEAADMGVPVTSGLPGAVTSIIPLLKSAETPAVGGAVISNGDNSPNVVPFGAGVNMTDAPAPPADKDKAAAKPVPAQ